MRRVQGYVVSERDVSGQREDGDTALVKVAIDSRHGCDRLEQRVMRFATGRSSPRGWQDREELLFVAAGSGAIELDGERHPLERDMGVYVAARETYVVVNEADEELLLVSVTAPASNGTPRAQRRVTVRYADQPRLPAGSDREFRYLVNQDAGCLDATQFLGMIPPSRAPLHSHTYDEVVYVLEGEGVLHVGDHTTPIAAGSCIHLPPLLAHCLENSGTAPMRVLGVFHPSGDPASRAHEETR